MPLDPILAVRAGGGGGRKVGRKESDQQPSDSLTPPSGLATVAHGTRPRLIDSGTPITKTPPEDSRSLRMTPALPPVMTLLIH